MTAAYYEGLPFCVIREYVTCHMRFLSNVHLLWAKFFCLWCLRQWMCKTVYMFCSRSSMSWQFRPRSHFLIKTRTTNAWKTMLTSTAACQKQCRHTLSILKLNHIRWLSSLIIYLLIYSFLHLFATTVSVINDKYIVVCW